MRRRERERDEYKAVRRRKERNPMSVNVYTTEIPTHATVIVFHDSVQSSTLVRVEDEGEVTIINNVSHDNLPGYLDELQATLLCWGSSSDRKDLPSRWRGGEFCSQ